MNEEASDLAASALSWHRHHQRQHALAEVGQVRELALAAQQLAAELVLELLDGARQRGLGNVAVLGRTSEVQFARYRQEVADVMHFHREPATVDPLSRRTLSLAV